MHRGLGDSVGGGNEGQEDGGPGGFQSVVQDGDGLISREWDLSAGGPSDSIPQVTEGQPAGAKSCRVQPSSEAERPQLYSIAGRCLELCNKLTSYVRT